MVFKAVFHPSLYVFFKLYHDIISSHWFRPLILVSLWMDSPHLINVETKEVFVLKEEGDDGEVSFLSYHQI